MTSALWHIGAVVGLIGFGVCASRSVCKREQGDTEGRNEQAARAMGFLVVVLVCGLLIRSL